MLHKSIQTNYDSLTGVVTDVINDFHIWQNADEVYGSTIDSYNSVSITKNTYYSNSGQGLNVIGNSTLILHFKGTRLLIF